ncbi:uncharacterized protein MAM_08434 [Metarhizium album ARSEF 1941]|uniref:Uncharacterized protein n=1 Tax=Metarhizium album (strain ARSEF 1941) TaxID=1081103 RepID=A0A0B2WJP6_METAS|nr:uncharacterized protein MAM_08434 [Metarhizium album ARSEF 1941]KHN93707.1 hypothetical protein MAM_08434 [Metarhizium album ARSEF 1941]
MPDVTFCHEQRVRRHSFSSGSAGGSDDGDNNDVVDDGDDDDNCKRAKQLCIIGVGLGLLFHPKSAAVPTVPSLGGRDLPARERSGVSFKGQCADCGRGGRPRHGAVPEDRRRASKGDRNVFNMHQARRSARADAGGSRDHGYATRSGGIACGRVFM